MSNEQDNKQEDATSFRQWQFHMLQESVKTLGRSGEKPSNSVAINLLIGLDIHYYLDYHESLSKQSNMSIFSPYLTQKSEALKLYYQKQRFLTHRQMLESLVKPDTSAIKTYVSLERERHVGLIHSYSTMRARLFPESDSPIQNQDMNKLQEANTTIDISRGSIQLLRWIEEVNMRGTYTRDVVQSIYRDYPYPRK